MHWVEESGSAARIVGIRRKRIVERYVIVREGLMVGLNVILLVGSGSVFDNVS